MLSIYIGIASVSVIIVSFCVDGLPKHFTVDTVDSSVADNTKGEVRSNFTN